MTGSKLEKSMANYATRSVAVTKSDSTVYKFKMLFVGGAGNVTIKHYTGGPDVTYTGVIAGTLLPVKGVRVMAATTATNITAMDWHDGNV